jgi:hypothetical protein
VNANDFAGQDRHGKRLRLVLGNPSDGEAIFVELDDRLALGNVHGSHLRLLRPFPSPVGFNEAGEIAGASLSVVPPHNRTVEIIDFEHYAAGIDPSCWQQLALSTVQAQSHALPNSEFVLPGHQEPFLVGFGLVH